MNLEKYNECLNDFFKRPIKMKSVNFDGAYSFNCKINLKDYYGEIIIGDYFKTKDFVNELISEINHFNFTPEYFKFNGSFILSGDDFYIILYQMKKDLKQTVFEFNGDFIQRIKDYIDNMNNKPYADLLYHYNIVAKEFDELLDFEENRVLTLSPPYDSVFSNDHDIVFVSIFNFVFLPERFKYIILIYFLIKNKNDINIIREKLDLLANVYMIETPKEVLKEFMDEFKKQNNNDLEELKFFKDHYEEI